MPSSTKITTKWCILKKLASKRTLSIEMQNATTTQNGEKQIMQNSQGNFRLLPLEVPPPSRQSDTKTSMKNKKQQNDVKRAKENTWHQSPPAPTVNFILLRPMHGYDGWHKRKYSSVAWIHKSKWMNKKKRRKMTLSTVHVLCSSRIIIIIIIIKWDKWENMAQDIYPRIICVVFYDWLDTKWLNNVRGPFEAMNKRVYVAICVCATEISRVSFFLSFFFLWEIAWATSVDSVLFRFLWMRTRRTRTQYRRHSWKFSPWYFLTLKSYTHRL